MTKQLSLLHYRDARRIVKDAKSRVNDGWCQYTDMDGKDVCASQAIIESVEMYCCDPDTVAFDIMSGVFFEDLVNNEAGGDIYLIDRYSAIEDLVKWNDAEHRTKEDVLAKFDRTLANLRRKEIALAFKTAVVEDAVRHLEKQDPIAWFLEKEDCPGERNCETVCPVAIYIQRELDGMGEYALLSIGGGVVGIDDIEEVDLGKKVRAFIQQFDHGYHPGLIDDDEDPIAAKWLLENRSGSEIEQTGATAARAPHGRPNRTARDTHSFATAGAE